MWQFIQPALTAVGINAGMNILGGRNPFANALPAAVMGGTGGAIGNMINAGKALEGAKVISNAAPSATSAFEASMNLPSSAMVSAGAPLASAMPTGAGMGLQFNPATGSYMNPDYYANILGNQTYTGGQGLLSNATGNLLDTLPDYVTPKNVIGAANVLASMERPQMIPAPSAPTRAGNVQGLNVNYGMAQPIPRRRGIM